MESIQALSEVKTRNALTIELWCNGLCAFRYLSRKRISVLIGKKFSSTCQLLFFFHILIFQLFCVHYDAMQFK